MTHRKPHDLLRTAELIAQYADLPMAFADTSLEAICERTSIGAIASLDSHFHIYRRDGRDAFRNVFPIH